MFRKLLKGTALLGMVGSVCVPAQAEIEFSGNVAFTNDYHWRGVTQTDQGFAVQGGFDVGFDNGFYVGTWASNVDAAGLASAELDLYGGYAMELENGLSFDVGVIQYLYTGGDDVRDAVEQATGVEVDLDFLEVYVGVGYALGDAEIGGFVAHDPDNENTYLEGSLGYSFSEDFGASLAVGNYDFDAGIDYTHTTLGLSYNVNDLFEIGAAYYTTDEDSIDEGFSVSISKSL